jgi:hypothetical protein
MLYVDLFDSKAIARFAYDPDAQRLFIDFKTGGVYAYQDVPRAVFAGFREAQSKGQFFQTAIRDRFQGRRLAPGEVAAIERRPARGTDSGMRESVRVDITALGRPGKRSVFF